MHRRLEKQSSIQRIPVFIQKNLAEEKHTTENNRLKWAK